MSLKSDRQLLKDLELYLSQSQCWTLRRLEAMQREVATVTGVLAPPHEPDHFERLWTQLEQTIVTVRDRIKAQEKRK